MLWLLKAEPDSRIVKGKDVKFSVDDFESVKTSPWEGVRNYEARNIMKEMKPGEKALFYHSNCKNPGIAAFAEVSKEAYPDYTAWDPSHPYFDPKSDKSSPKWFMVDLLFNSRTTNFVPLALLKHISEHANELPEELAYIGSEGAKAIRDMDLINRGRLSVQRVQKPAWDAIELLAERGGWDESTFGKGKAKTRKSEGTASGNASKNNRGKGKESTGGTKKTRSGKRKEVIEEEEQHSEENDVEPEERGEENGHNTRDSNVPSGKGQKRKAAGNEHADKRPSTRARRSS